MKNLLKFFFIFHFSFFIFFASCIKDEPENNECDILSAWVEGSEYEGYFFQRTQMKVEEVPSNSSSVVFTVRSVDSLPPMPVYFALSAGATITPANGSLQDFSQGHVTYTVTSEDGEWKRTYRVHFQSVSADSSYLFSFEHVDVEEMNNGSSYHVFYEEVDGIRHDWWASGNAGVAILRQNQTPEQFPTYSTAGGFCKKGVCLSTQLTGELGAAMNKPIAAGNLFLGRFKMEAVLTNALAATEFGIPTDQQPTKVSGWYRYHPGEVFTNIHLEEVPGRTDKGHIYAVFYRNQDAAGNPVVLNGSNVLTSEYIVSKTQLIIPSVVDEWTHFEMTFEGGIADPEILASMGYSFTVVFSSSKDGDLFEGAVGSTLEVDEVRVEF